MKSRMISRPAAIVVIIAFFLPLITVSCSGSGTGIQISGYQMGTGINIYGQQVNGDPLHFLLIGFAVFALIGSFFAVDIGRKFYLVASLAGLGFLVERAIYWQNVVVTNAQREGVFATITHEIGYWLLVAGYVGILFAWYVARHELDFDPKARQEWMSGSKSP